MSYIGSISTTLNSVYTTGGSASIQYNGKLYLFSADYEYGGFAVIDVSNPTGTIQYSGALQLTMSHTVIPDWTAGYVWLVQFASEIGDPVKYNKSYIQRFNLDTLAFEPEIVYLSNTVIEDGHFIDVKWKSGIMASDGNIYIVADGFDEDLGYATNYVMKITSGLVLTSVKFRNPYTETFNYGPVIEVDGHLYARASGYVLGPEAYPDNVWSAFGVLMKYNLSTGVVSLIETPPNVGSPSDMAYSSVTRTIYMHGQRFYDNGVVASMPILLGFNIDTETVTWQVDYPSEEPGYALYIDEDLRLWTQARGTNGGIVSYSIDVTQVCE